MRVVVINPNSSPTTTADLVALAALLRPGWDVRGITAGSGPSVITTPAALADAAVDVSAPTVGAGLGECDAVIVGAFGDPGIEGLRANLSVPVVGFGEAGIAAAAQQGAFGIVTTTPALDGPLRDLVDRHDPGRLFRGFAFAEPPVEPGAHALARALGRAVETSGIDVPVWLVGGGPLALAARILAEAADYVVVDCVSAAVEAVEREVSP